MPTKYSARYYFQCTFVGLAFSMLGYIDNYRMKSVCPDTVFDTLGHKIVTAFNKNKDLKKPLPIIIATVFLFNTQTGQLKTVIDGNNITAWRTAGSCMVATKYLYFDRNEHNKSDKVLAILGCGVQVKSCNCYDFLLKHFRTTLRLKFREEFMQSEFAPCSR